MQRLQSEKGTAELISMLLVLSIMLALAAVAAPSAIKLTQINKANNAAEALAQIGTQGESNFARSYGAYVPLQNLTGTLTQPISCQNSSLLNGEQIQNPAGYVFSSPVMTGSVAGFSCSGITGAAGYTINADPDSSLSGTRHFFMDQTGVVRYTDDNREAVVTDQIFPVIASNGTPVIGGMGTGSGTNPSSGSSTVQIWSPTANVTPGSTWIMPSNDPAGGTCSPSNGGYVGLFVALPTAVPGEDPCLPTSATDFIYAGSGSVSYVPALPNCGGTLTGSLGNFNIPYASGISIPWTGTSGTLVTITPPNACGNFTHFILQEVAGYTPGSGTEMPAQFGMTESINQTSIGGCMQGNGVGVSYGTNAFNQCQSTWGSINLSRGDTLYLWVAGAPPAFSIQTVTWTLAP